MTKEVLHISLDPDVVAGIESDKGLAATSTYLNHLLKTFYSSDNHGMAKEIEIVRAARGHRDVIEVAQVALSEYLTKVLAQEGI